MLQPQIHCNGLYVCHQMKPVRNINREDFPRYARKRLLLFKQKRTLQVRARSFCRHLPAAISRYVQTGGCQGLGELSLQHVQPWSKRRHSGGEFESSPGRPPVRNNIGSNTLSNRGGSRLITYTLDAAHRSLLPSRKQLFGPSIK